MLVRFLIAAVLAVLPCHEQSVLDSGATQTPPKDCVSWYPLAVGNKWVYETRIMETGETSRVKWQVNQLTVENGKEAYVVWPEPLPSDDAQWWLNSSESGIEDVMNGMFLLRCPPRAGNRWTHEHFSVLKNRTVRNSFHVVSVGKPCRTKRFKFSSCLVIQEFDEEFDRHTTTTYARGVGPIRFEYRSSTVPGVEPRLVEIDELTEYRLK